MAELNAIVAETDGAALTEPDDVAVEFREEDGRGVVSVDLGAGGRDGEEKDKAGHDQGEMPLANGLGGASSAEVGYSSSSPSGALTKGRETSTTTMGKLRALLATAKCFTTILVIAGLVEGALVSGFTSVVISSIEKRYSFSSTAASFIAGVFDLAVLVCVVVVGHFGSQSHKPRWLGIGLFIMAAGAFLFALPQFIFGPYKVGTTAQLQLEACEGFPFSLDCSSANNIAYAIFVIANILIGIGASPLFVLGPVFIDEIVLPKYVSIHLGLFYVSSVVGPAFGYGLGGLFLSIYVDPWRDTSLEESDPGWVGGWWICFVFTGVISILCAIPFMFFPRTLSNSAEVEKARRKQSPKTYTSKYSNEKSFFSLLKAFPRHLMELSLSWLAISVAIASSYYVLSGMVTFAPKYLEAQYGIKASTASLLVGGVGIPFTGAGILFGALGTFLLKSKPRRVALMNAILALLVVLPMIGFLLGCSEEELAGVTVSYANPNMSSTGEDVLSAYCNSRCNCTSSTYEPVCGADNITYFSPCRAGCDKAFVGGSNKSENAIFENCSCISESLLLRTNLTVVSLNGTREATSGRCDNNCNRLVPFMAIVALFLFLIFTTRVPILIVTIRSVADEQRSLALAVQSCMFRLFGSVPGSLTLGAIIDSTCLYWQYDCGRRGNCWEYDNQALSHRAVAYGCSGLALAFLFALLAWILFPKSSGMEDLEMTADTKDTRETVVSAVNPLQEDEY